jgi:hypothetical protein
MHCIELGVSFVEIRHFVIRFSARQCENRRFQCRATILVSVTLALILATLFVPRIPQDQAYRNFADQRAFFRHPSFLRHRFQHSILLRPPISARCVRDSERWAYFTLFAGVLPTCFGSLDRHRQKQGSTA